MLSLVVLSLSILGLQTSAAPISFLRRGGDEPFVLPTPTDGPGPTFDATATRVATSAQIRSVASPNLCFDVSDFRSGDFRFNLVPIALQPCDGSVDGQKFDLITKGAHNNVEDGSRTLIVSSQQLTCVDRRSNKDHTRPGLFACGGRAAGDGETTADQQYFFNSTANFSTGVGFPLARDAVNNGIGPGNQCLTLNSDGFLSNTPCSPPLFTPEQSWIIGESGSTVSPSAVSNTPASSFTQAASSTQCQTTSTTTMTHFETITVGTTSASIAATPTGAPAKFVLPVPQDGPGPTFDTSAIRAATSAQIRSAASPDVCFDVSDFRAGDFRFNNVPLALKKCDASIDGQKFDLITKGEHNNVADGTRTLIASSQQFTCVDRRSNINDRTRPGLFACGGRAAGDGETTPDQQFFFNSSASLADGIGFPITRDAVNSGIGPGNQCLTLNADGFVSNTPCSPPFFTREQTWIITPPNASDSATTSISTSSPATTESATSVMTTSTPSTVPVTTSVSPTSTSVPSGVPEKFVLPIPAEGPGPLFDATATRAATNAQIRSAASPDICIDVSNFRAGDFRFNLVPLALKKCDSSIDGQKFDLITKGVHNNVLDGSRTLIVSSQQFTCVDRLKNNNDHTRPGLFACGGRAVGDGKTQSDEQFFFNVTASLSDGIGFPYVTNAVNGGMGPGNQCLTLNEDGFVSNTPCSPPLFTPEQTWIVG